MEEYENETGSGLRSQLEKALETIKTQNQQLEMFRQEAREAKLTTLISSKGISPKVAKLIPADVQDEASLESWLTDYADVFGTGTTAVDDKSAVADTTPQPVDTEAAATSSRITNLNNNAAPQAVVADFETRIRNAKDNAEVDAIMKEAQSYFL